MMNRMQLLVKKILIDGCTQDINRDWLVQGTGQLRLNLSSEARLHVWSEKLVDKPGMIHNHAANFESLVIAGSLCTVRYREIPKLEPNHKIAEIVHGANGGVLPDTIRDAHLEISSVEQFKAGDTYYQPARELHNTIFENGTVTFIRRQLVDNIYNTTVGFGLDGEWDTAEPRIATEEEVQYALKSALDLLQS